MFYETRDNRHGLKHDPFKALAVPRPIGWISTLSKDGICNLAPYSFFNAVGEKPHYVVFGSGGVKDSLANIEETGEFVCSLATYDLRFHMNMSSASVPRGVDEFPIAGLTAAPSRMVKPPRVKESPAAFECRRWKTIDLPPAEPGGESTYTLVIGLVVGVYIDDAYIKSGLVDTGAMRPIARLGYMDYAVVTPETIFSIKRPSPEEAMARLNAERAAKSTGQWPEVTEAYRTAIEQAIDAGDAGLAITLRLKLGRVLVEEMQQIDEALTVYRAVYDADSENAVRQAIETWGDLHVVLNNAGVNRDRMFASMTEAEWDTIMAVHLKGHFCISSHAVHYWRDQSKAGHKVDARIINTTSGAGLQGSIGNVCW